MKLNRQAPFLCLAALALLAATARAQGDVKTRDIEILETAYKAGRVDGVQVAVLLKEPSGRYTPVSPSREFKLDDRFKVTFQSNFAGYVYIVNVGSSGRIKVLFPQRGENNRVAPGLDYVLPRMNDMVFTGPAGLEILQVFMSRAPVPVFEAALDTREGLLKPRDYTLAVNRWGVKLNSQQSGIVTQSQALSTRPGVRTRDPIWNSEKKAATITVQRQNAPARSKTKSRPLAGLTRLRAREVAAFSLNLKHSGARE